MSDEPVAREREPIERVRARLEALVCTENLIGIDCATESPKRQRG
jgi:hypothetical protein